ncbi:MAG: 4Fe-4S binding protein [Clostridia bacterium]|nr:4Fe-4S binding protein [Clostridia bacterium]
MIKITIHRERCKGCSLCIPFCPKGILKTSETLNSSGYHPVFVVRPEDCTGCAACAKMCPDLAIEIVREE